MSMPPAPAALSLVPIGVLRTPFATLADCPRNGRALHPPPLCHAELAEGMEEGLESIEGFSHLILLYWLGGDFPRLLRVTPRSSDRPRGVFATRSPRRPNPIGLSVVTLEGRQGRRLALRNLDCLDGTPLLDIKPYIARTDAEAAASRGWLGE